MSTAPAPTATAPTADELRRRVRQLAKNVGTAAPEIPVDASLSEVRAAVRQFVELCGFASYCRGCQASIVWVEHENGKRCPYNREALSHFADCPEAAAFRRKRRSKR